MTSRDQTLGERAAAARLLALAAHELRTPLSVVSGYLRMLQRDPALSEQHRKWIDDADKACTRLNGIVIELSDVGKLDAGQTVLQADALDLTALLREVGSTVTEASDRGVRLTLRGCDGRTMMRGDRAHLRTTFITLARAVLREQHEGASVTVHCESVGGHATIVIGKSDVVDQAATQTRAPFDDGRGGLGLALPMARRVIEAHGGTIWSPAQPDGAATARSAVLVSLPVGD